MERGCVLGEGIARKTKGRLVNMYCPSCEGEIEFPADAVGQVVACPHCEIDIALAPETPAPAPRRRASGGKSKAGLISAIVVAVVGLVVAGVIYGPKLMKSGGLSMGEMSTPDGAVKAVARGLAEHDAGVLWDAMPAIYQKDVNELVRTYADSIDPKVWDRSVALNARVVGLLENKKEFIFNNPRLANVPNKAEVMKHYDSAIGLMNILMKSDLSKLETLKTLDVGEYLDTTGSQVLKEVAGIIDAVSGGKQPNPLKDLAKISVAVEQSEGRMATLLITPFGQMERRVEFVEIEGRWVPRAMSDAWPESMEMAKQSVAMMKQQSQQVGAQMNMVFGMAEGMLAQFENAKTQKDFDAAVQGAMGLMGGFGGRAKAGGPPGR